MFRNCEHRSQQSNNNSPIFQLSNELTYYTQPCTLRISVASSFCLSALLRDSSTGTRTGARAWWSAGCWDDTAPTTRPTPLLLGVLHVHCVSSLPSRPLSTIVIRYPLWMTRRWKRDDDNRIVVDENFHPLLEFVAIKRKDNGEWAIPGVRCPAFCALLPSRRLLSFSRSRAWWMQASRCH